MTRRASVLNAIEPEPYVHISPADLIKWSISPGDQVRVATKRGTIELSARSDSGVPDGVVFIPFCYAEAAVNFLTNSALDPFGKIPELKFSAAKLEKIEAHSTIG
jgi:formate dehydrogenase major subunit